MAEKKTNFSKITELFPKDLEIIKAGVKRYIGWIHGQLNYIRRVLVYLLLTILSVFAAFLVFLFVELLDKYEEVQEERVDIQAQGAYWEKTLKDQQNSPDLYFQAALYAYRLGDEQKAFEYVSRALFLDPGFEDAKELKMKIAGK